MAEWSLEELQGLVRRREPERTLDAVTGEVEQPGQGGRSKFGVRDRDVGAGGCMGVVGVAVVVRLAGNIGGEQVKDR
jgi:hypothetical protein